MYDLTIMDEKKIKLCTIAAIRYNNLQDFLKHTTLLGINEFRRREIFKEARKGLDNCYNCQHQPSQCLSCKIA